MLLKKLFFFVLILYLSGCTTYKPGQYLDDYKGEFFLTRISKEFDVFLDDELFDEKATTTYGKKLKFNSRYMDSNTDGYNESQASRTAGITALTILTLGGAALVWFPIFPWAWNSQTVELSLTYNGKRYAEKSTTLTWIGTANGDTKARDISKVKALKELLNQLDRDIYYEKDLKNAISKKISPRKIEKISKEMLASLKLNGKKQHTIVTSSDSDDELSNLFNIILKNELVKKENIQIVNYKDNMIHEVRKLRNSEEIKQEKFYGKKKLLSPEYSLKTFFLVHKKYGTFVDVILTHLPTGVVAWEGVEKIY